MKIHCAICGKQMYIFKPYTSFICKECEEKEANSKEYQK